MNANTDVNITIESNNVVMRESCAICGFYESFAGWPVWAFLDGNKGDAVCPQCVERYRPELFNEMTKQVKAIVAEGTLPDDVLDDFKNDCMRRPSIEWARQEAEEERALREFFEWVADSYRDVAVKYGWTAEPNFEASEQLSNDDWLLRDSDQNIITIVDCAGGVLVTLGGVTYAA